MNEIINELTQIGNELFIKYGADSYTTRCRLHDTREKLKALTLKESIKSLDVCENFKNGKCNSCELNEHKECNG
jgi:hypothetical protein